MAIAEATDGRVLRGRRNRTAVVESFLALIEEGDLRPTARTIAERAGVSLRSVFQHFEDLEQIFLEGGRREYRKLAPLLSAVPPSDASFDARLDAYVGVRRQLLEAIDPVARASRLREPFSAQLRANRDFIVEAARHQCEETFAAELKRRRGAARRQLLDAAVAASSWASWYALREEMGRSAEEATAVMRQTLHSLLAPEKRRLRRSAT